MVAGSSFAIAKTEAVLCVPVADVSGAALRLFTQPPDHSAVLSRRVEVEDWVVVLDVLAASHRITVLDADPRPVRSSRRALVSETVACMASGAAPDDPSPVASDALPAEHQWSASGLTMRFTARTIVGDAAVEAAADELDALDPESTSLVARFPGHPLARTALAVGVERVNGEPQLTWNSWHLYPGIDPHVVMSQTTATPNPTGGARRWQR